MRRSTSVAFVVLRGRLVRIVLASSYTGHVLRQQMSTHDASTPDPCVHTLRRGAYISFAACITS